MADDKYYDLEHDTVEDGEHASIPVRIHSEPKLTMTAEERRRRKQKLRERTGSTFKDWMDPRNPALWDGDEDED
jgi:hypothetical protein